MVPPMGEEDWPTLGPLVCDWIEANLVFGPGDIRGEPAKIDDETRALIYRAYEVFPKGHEQAGRRRFKRCVFSLRKGTAKTEKGAWIAAAELHHEAPVRFDGWDARGNPVGRPVDDPYIPMVAYTEEQSEELAYGALYVVLSEGPLADDFDIGLERIMRLDGRGKAVALAGAPNARDGARTTFQHFDETHRMVLERLLNAHQTMMANLPKRKASDPWALETTTAPAPGEGSVAEGTMDYARLIANGKVKESRLFFFHREAGSGHDLNTHAGLRSAVIEASGPAAEWADIDGIVELAQDPQTDRRFWERVWLNRLVQASGAAFDAERWKDLAIPPDEEGRLWRPEPGRRSLVVLGFDGARTRDATALVGTDVYTAQQWLLGVWERPDHLDEWEVPRHEVDAVVEDAMATWDVWRLYADPYWWETVVADWAGHWKRRGKPVVYEWHTNRPKPMALACRAFASAIRAGEVTHNGDPALAAHVGNARKNELNLFAEDGDRLWTIRKERPDSPFKIDAAMAATLSWEAYRDACSLGLNRRRSRTPRSF